VLGFTLALALATGMVFGLAPAVQATKVDLTPALKENRVGGAQQGQGRRMGLGISLSQALVASQIAISLLLVMAAGLFGARFPIFIRWNWVSIGRMCCCSD